MTVTQVGVSIFFREAQLVWPELRPYMDKRAGECAAQMGLPDDADKLSELVGGDTQKLATLAAALVRVSLAKGKGIVDIAEGVEADRGDGKADGKAEETADGEENGKADGKAEEA